MNSMNHPPRIGYLIMAAGNASRFGSNKLAAKVDGKMLIEHALEALERAGFTVAVNRELPPNDGCVSYGQAVVAWAANDEKA